MTVQKVFPVRMDEDLYKDLRKLSYLTELPIAEIIRQAVKVKIESHRKLLTNSDIAI